MFDVSSSGVIKITRGDSAYFTINLTDAENNPYILEAEDKVRVQVRSKYNDDENEGFLFEGEIIDNGNGTVVWHIKPEDTATANNRITHIISSNTWTIPCVFKIFRCFVFCCHTI